MQVTPSSIVKLSLPSLFLFYSLSPSSFEAPTFKESYADGRYSLDLNLDVDPKAFLQKSLRESRIYFTGAIVRAERAEEIFGYRLALNGHHYYVFRFGEGEFVGELNGRRLRYWIRNSRQILRTGFLSPLSQMPE